MKIDLLEVRYVRLPLKDPWRTSYGIDTQIHSIIVHLVADGVEGWAETSPLHAPTYSPECAPGVFVVLTEFLVPYLLEHLPEHPSQVPEILSVFRGNPFAKGVLDGVLWDHLAHSQGKPLHELWGGTRRTVEAGADFGIDLSIDTLLGKIQRAIDAGHKRIKLKVSHAWDVEVVRAVRTTWPGLTFHVDCNSCYRLPDDLPRLKEMDKYGLAMFEQPLFHTDLVEHADLQKQLETPICLDESVNDVRQFELALRLGSCRVINVKFGRVGGFTNALKIEKLAREAGMPAWVGGMLESSIGGGLCLELASMPGFTYPGDIFPSSKFYTEDLTDPELVLAPDGTFTVSDKPGTGYRPIMDRVEARTERCVRFDGQGRRLTN